MSEDLYLKSGDFVDSAHPDVAAYANAVIGAETNPKAAFQELFYRVRDDFLYDPYMPLGVKSSYTAIDVLKSGKGWCVPKAALLAACARAIGIPARPGYADVVNHLATQKLLDSIGTDVFYWHSYCEVFLDGRWVKCTPAFNLSMCEKFGLKPLDFDGETDSLFHEFDNAGNRHMEYIQDRGTYFDVPFDDIVQTYKTEYKNLAEFMDQGIDGDFQAEAGQG